MGLKSVQEFVEHLIPELCRIDPSVWKLHHFGLPQERWSALEDRHFWIPGGGTGYGRAIAHALCAARAHVWISGRRREKLNETIESGIGHGIDMSRCSALPADIRDEASLAAAMRDIARRTGKLDGLVLCAALPQPRPKDAGPGLLSLDRPSWETLMATNVTGSWLCFRAAWPLLAAGPGMRVIFFSSEAGWSFTPGFGPYNVSKAALNNLGASLAAETVTLLPERDTQINVLDPGEARTEMNQGSSHSPYSVVCMTLALLSHPAGGPNGRFFHRDGRHLAYSKSRPFAASVLPSSANG